MVKSKELYSPQTYIELITGACHIIDGDDDLASIKSVLKQYGRTAKSYELDEIRKVLQDNADVVLVDCMKWDNSENEYKHHYYWLEA